jgi:putative ABC transport system permease protein
VIGAFAVVAFLLAGIGIHGLLALAVSQRSREIGVRVALGAAPRDILVLIMRRGILLTIAGIVPGVLLAYLAGRAMSALLAGITPADPATFLLSVTLAFVMALLGSLVPTLRALRVDPIQALR